MLTDRVSQMFDYTNEGHEEYLAWKKRYSVDMLKKYGMRSKNVLATHFESEVDGERKMLVVLQHEMASERST